MEVRIFGLLALVSLGSASLPDNSISNDLTPDRQRRSFEGLSEVPIIGSLFGSQEPELPHLGQYPLWKVHRYHGISLQPIPIPEEEVPVHPVAPTHDVEAPSVVNVPDPHYAPKEPVPLPPNEYGPPAPSGPYPTANAPSGPYPSGPYPPANAPSGPYPSAPSGPYPPANAPSGPYPSAPSGPYPAAPSGPYPAPSPPSAPHPPIYNAPEHPRGHAELGVAEFAIPHSDPHFSDILSQLESGGINLEGGLGGLLSVLPSDVGLKLQQYLSTPEGRERVSAIIGIASNAKKLKAGATRSLQDIFGKFFGGAGGSSKFALQSGTYTNIPHPYPAPQGILNSFRAVGTGVSGSVLPSLPELPTLPKIPGLGPLPETPGLPHINLPANSHTAGKTGGHYVSISLPQPPSSYGVPEVRAPTDSYGLPPAAPAPAYGPPAQTYQAPPQIPSTSYGVPAGLTFPYQTPSQPAPPSFHNQHHSYDHSFAASENHEEYQPRGNGHQEAEDDDDSQEPLKTTKLQPAKEPQTYNGDELRRYLDVAHPASLSFKPSQPVQAEEEDEYLEEGEE